MEGSEKRTVMVLILILLKVNLQIMNKRISINQFAEYSAKKRESSKLRIIKQQKIKDQNLFFWYQRAKSSIRKSLREGGDLIPIYNGIETLMDSSPKSKPQIDNKNVSILALEQFAALKLPNCILENKFEILRFEKKSVEISGLEISLSPEFIFRITESNGETIVGAIKIHICKSKPFSLQTAELASTVLYEFLKVVANQVDKVDPKYCFTIDIFGGRVVPVPESGVIYHDMIIKLCEEIVNYWNVA